MSYYHRNHEMLLVSFLLQLINMFPVQVNNILKSMGNTLSNISCQSQTHKYGKISPLVKYIHWICSVEQRNSSTMEGKCFLTEDSAYKSIQEYFNKHGKSINILDMFKSDSERFNKFR